MNGFKIRLRTLSKMVVCVIIYSRNLLKMAAAKNDYDLPNFTGLNWTCFYIYKS